MPLDGSSYETPAVARLRVARDRVAAGWVQHQCYGNVDGVPGYCASMALCYNAAHLIGMKEAIKLLCRSIGVESLYFVPIWNDATERTQAEVVAAYDRAIEMAMSYVGS